MRATVERSPDPTALSQPAHAQCRAPRHATRHLLTVGAGSRTRRRPRRQRRGRPDLRVPAMWKTAAQRLRPIRPPARPASARSSAGQPPASASLGQPRVNWQLRSDWPAILARFTHRYAAEGKPLARGMRQLLEEGDANVARAPVGAATVSIAGLPPYFRLACRPRRCGAELRACVRGRRQVARRLEHRQAARTHLRPGEDRLCRDELPRALYRAGAPISTRSRLDLHLQRPALHLLYTELY